MSVSPVQVDDMLVNNRVDEMQTTAAARSIAVDHDGDFVVVWTGYDELFQVDPVTGDPIIDPITGLPKPVIDQLTGDPMTDANVYARYFTDEVQRITLPDGVADDVLSGSFGKFSLSYGGNEIQKLKISATYAPEPASFFGFGLNENIAAEIVLGFDLSGNGIISPEETTKIIYRESPLMGVSVGQHLRNTAEQIQTALRGLGGELDDVRVQGVNPREFLIHFGEAAAGKDVPEITIESDVYSAGFLPVTEISTVRNSLELNNILVSPTNPALTALAIEQAFLRTSGDFLIGPVDFPPPNRLPPAQGNPVEGPYFVPEFIRTAAPKVQVTAISLTEFDITFVGDSGKQDHPLLEVTEVEDEFGNSLIDSPQLDVSTIKEPSPEFRVNPPEPDNPITIEPDKHDQLRPAVAMDADGEFIITWEGAVTNFENYGSMWDIFARRFAPVGVVDPNDVSLVVDMDLDGVEETPIQGVRSLEIPPEADVFRVDDFTFRVNSLTPNPQFQPAVAMDDEGAFVIAWASGGQDMSFFNGISAQQFNRDGTPRGSEFQVNVEDTSVFFDPSVALSHDGNILITWSVTDEPGFVVPPPIGPANFLVNVEAKVYDPAGVVLLDQFVVSGGGNSAAAFDGANHFIITWAHGDETDNSGFTSSGARGQMYELFAPADPADPDAPTDVPSGAVIREEFAVNSADLDPDRDPYWPLFQMSAQPAIDADGDLVISYEGYGPDVSEWVDSTMDLTGKFLGAIAQEINPTTNADLLTFFDPIFDTLPIGYLFFGDLADVDAVIDEIMVRAYNFGATDSQLGRLRAIIDRSAGLLRGDAYAAMFSRFDADPTGGTFDILYSDSIANTFRDGRNSRFIITLDPTVAGGNFVIELFHPRIGGSELVTVAVDVDDNVLDPYDTADNIDAALEAAARTGLNWPEDAFNGPISVRVINDGSGFGGFGSAFMTEIEEREGTPWEISDMFGSISLDNYVFEVTFQGEVHDEAMFIFLNDNNLTMPERDEQQVLVFSPLGFGPLQGNFTLTSGTETSNAITFNSLDLLATAVAIQNAIVNDLGLAGVTVTPSLFGPPYQFIIDYADDSGGEDQPPLQGQASGTIDDVPPPLSATIAAFTTEQGGPSGDAPPPFIEQFTMGSEGTWQTEVSIGMQPDGDFVMVWTQMDMYTDEMLANNTVYFREFNEETDTAGPLVTGLVAPDGTQTGEGERFPVTSGLQHMVLTFDEEMLVEPDVAAQLQILGITEENASDAMLRQLELRWDRSVTNPNNYRLLTNGIPVGGSIVQIEFGMNKAAELSEEFGLNPLPSNKWEAILTVDANALQAGFQPLPLGQYTIEVMHPILQSNTEPGQTGVHDKVGNPLGHTGFVPGGESFIRTFEVVIGDGPGSPGSPGEGSENLPINLTPIGRQNDPAVAIDETGDYVVVWASYGQGLDAVTEGDIIAQRFDRRGQRIGPEFVVNTYQLGSQVDPDVAMDPAGNFVVTWSGAGPIDNSGVFVRSFDRFGRSRGDQVRANQFRQLTQAMPSVATDGSGSFVVSWTSDMQDGTGAEIFARRYSSAGPAMGDEFRVNSFSSFRQQSSDVGMDGSGNFVIVWESSAQDGSLAGVYGQRYNSTGGRRGSEFRVNQTTLNAQDDPSVSMAENGRFVVSWTSAFQDGSGDGVYARLFNAAGSGGSEFRVNQTTLGTQNTSSVGLDKNGNFSIVWTSFNQDDQDTADFGIYGRMYLANGSHFIAPETGQPLGEFRINATTAGDQVSPAVARATDNGDYVVVWVGPDFDQLLATPIDTDIYARLLDPPVKPPVDTGGGETNPTILDVKGTSGDDLFEFIAAADPGSWLVKLNGVTKGVASSLIEVRFDGLAGNDVVYLTGTSQDETADVHPDHATLIGDEYTVTITSAEAITIAGRGGYDTITLHGSSQKDLFSASGDEITFTSSIMDHSATGFESVLAQATPGGNDEADLYDSPGNDILITRPALSRLAGDGFQYQVEDFAVVHAYATAGGQDSAKMFDSSGNDLFRAEVNQSRLSGDGFETNASFFDSVHAYATAGGSDMAELIDSGGDDLFTAGPVESSLIGLGLDNRVSYFDQVIARALNGGDDTARLNDSAGDDQFVATDSYGLLSGEGFSNRAENFETVHAFAQSGFDTADLFDSPGNDYFVAASDFGVLYGAGFYNRAEGFDRVDAHASTGSDTAKLFDSYGDDHFVATPDEGTLSGSGFENRALGFDAVHAYSTAGGTDRADLHGSDGNDVYRGDADSSSLTGSGFYNRARHFEQVRAHAEGGGTDSAVLHDALLGDPGGQLAQLAWLYEFEQMTNDDESVDDAAIDGVLAAYWP